MPWDYSTNKHRTVDTTASVEIQVIVDEIGDMRAVFRNVRKQRDMEPDRNEGEFAPCHSPHQF